MGLRMAEWENANLAGHRSIFIAIAHAGWCSAHPRSHEKSGVPACAWYGELGKRPDSGPRRGTSPSAPAGDKPPHYISSRSPPLWIPAFAGIRVRSDTFAELTVLRGCWSGLFSVPTDELGGAPMAGFDKPHRYIFGAHDGACRWTIRLGKDWAVSGSHAVTTRRVVTRSMSRLNSSPIWYTSVNSAKAQRPYWRRLLTPGDPVGVHRGLFFLGVLSAR